jgi:hypothetical protein
MAKPKIADTVVDCIGGTPMVRLQKLNGTLACTYASAH